MKTAEDSGRYATGVSGRGLPRHRPGQAEPGLTIEDLSAGYDTVIVSGVSLDVRSREIVALIGPDGAGKPTSDRRVPRGFLPGAGMTCPRAASRRNFDRQLLPSSAGWTADHLSRPMSATIFTWRRFA